MGSHVSSFHYYREKRDYYRDILLEQLESSDDGSSSSSSSDEMSELSDDFPVDQEAPPVWSNMKNWVPKAAAYDIPRPPLSKTSCQLISYFKDRVSF